MTTPESRLLAYLDRKKFSDREAWLRRGVNPSAEAVCESMEQVVNGVCTAVLDSIRRDEGVERQKRAALRELRKHRSSNYDTEEREFLCSEIEAVGNLAAIELGPELNTWLYGSVLGAFTNFLATRSSQRVALAHYSVKCDDCGADLSVKVTKQDKAIPDAGWIAGRCDRCATLNLVRVGPNAKQMTNHGFSFVRQLKAEEFTAESAAAWLRDMRAKRSS